MAGVADVGVADEDGLLTIVFPEDLFPEDLFQRPVSETSFRDLWWCCVGDWPDTASARAGV